MNFELSDFFSPLDTPLHSSLTGMDYSVDSLGLLRSYMLHCVPHKTVYNKYQHILTIVLPMF